MSPCARSCCWVPMAGVCGRNRSCACHWEERKPAGQTNGAATHRDPTANQAINNVMNPARRRT